MFSGCNQKASYSPGLYVDKVSGEVRLEGEEPQKVFILVQQKHRTFLEQGNQPLFTETARLLHPDSTGHYSISFKSEVVEIRLSFFSEGYLMDRAVFQQTFGVGDIEYNTELGKSGNWKKDFVLLVRPFLSGFILEKEYHMSDYDQLFLGNWLSEAERKLP